MIDERVGAARRAMVGVSRRDVLRYGAMGLVAAVLPAGSLPVRAGPAGQMDSIVQCVIHPAIGIARVGNSPDEYFLGPELPGPQAVPEGGFKDASGRIKRQAARFRVFGLDADGDVVTEITADDARIVWTAHLANKKAAWYQFDKAFDVPEARGDPPGAGLQAGAPLSSARRNQDLAGADRAKLVVDPGPRSIEGRAVNSDGNDSRFAFDSGQFVGQPVPLGELRTDESGRLLVFGGFGNSAPTDPTAFATSVGNNDLWYDDVSDGPVEATIYIGNRALQATGAWAVVAPPDFAPGIQSVVTMYDVVFEVSTSLEPELAPARPSFTRQIYPLLARHVQHQWVNAGFARDFGWGTASDFLAPETLARLAEPSNDNRFLREQVFRSFRNPAYANLEANALPPYYGDAIQLPPLTPSAGDANQLPPQTPRQWMAVLDIQYGWLRQWANGDFDADWPDGGLQFPERVEDLPLAEQPGALDRAALDECLGGSFHPGIELTWPMRITSLYEAPFRLRRRAGPEPDWGDMLTSAIALDANGPLSASSPGDLTRWMGVPWQTDTASCLSGYIPEAGEFLPTFWPARVPNDVLTMQSYQTLLNPAASPEQKQAAFAAREKWLRDLPLGRGAEQQYRINVFAHDWSRFGIVTPMPGPSGDAAFPATIWVEAERQEPTTP